MTELRLLRLLGRSGSEGAAVPVDARSAAGIGVVASMAVDDGRGDVDAAGRALVKSSLGSKMGGSYLLRLRAPTVWAATRCS